MTDPLYRSRGKGYAEIARDARRILDAIGSVGPDGTKTITSDSILAVLDEVDDRGHFEDPLAQGLYALLMSRGGSIVLDPIEGGGTN